MSLVAQFLIYEFYSISFGKQDSFFIWEMPCPTLNIEKKMGVIKAHNPRFFFSSCLQSPASVHFSQQQKEWTTAFVMSSVHFISILYVMLCNKVAKYVSNIKLISSLAFLSLSIFTYLIKSIEQIWHVFHRLPALLYIVIS